MSSLEFAPPKYVQIVRAIQERIEDGSYPVGEMLPSESRMVREFGAGRSTVVRALQILSMQGWIDREHGRGSFVRGVPQQNSERSHAGASAFDASEEAKHNRILAAGRTPVTVAVAEAIGIPEGSPAVMRQRLVLDEGQPSELVTLWFPPHVAEGTDLGETQSISIGAREHVQMVKQLRPSTVAERLCARLATDAERSSLALEEVTPVLCITARILDAAGDVIAVAEVVLPGDLHELEDTYPAA